MADSADQDMVTKLNTQLNKTMILMEDIVDTPPQHNKEKIIKLNTKVQRCKTSVTPAKSRKSILKKSDKSLGKKEIENKASTINNSSEELNNVTPRLSIDASDSSRPRNLQELVKKDILEIESMSSTFNLEEISTDEDIWIMELPKSIDPQQLYGQTIVLGDKSKIKIKEERFCAVTQSSKCNFTCVFNSNNATSQFKTANMKLAGSLVMRRKLSSAFKTKLPALQNNSVPFPDNLKVRHPLLGAKYHGNHRRLSTKHSSFKKRK